MKKIIIVVAVSLLMMLSACGGGDSDSSGTGNNNVISADDKVETEIAESGYSVSVLEDSSYAKYGFVICNPSDDVACMEPTVTVTAYDNSGEVLGTDEKSFILLQPGETQAFSGIIDCYGKTPSKVEFVANEGQKVEPSGDAIQSSDLEIIDTNERSDGSVISITGKVKNNTKHETSSVVVNVFFRKDGKIVGGYSEFIDGLSAGGEQPFELRCFSVEEHDSFEVSAFNWGT